MPNPPKKLSSNGLFGLGKTPSSRPGKKVTGSGKRVVGDKDLNQSWLQATIKDLRTDRRPLWTEVNDGGWHPSGMGEPCDRRSILKMYGYRGDIISQKLSRIFDFGKAIEKIWQADFAKKGILLSKNVKVPDPGPPPINGEYDVMLRHPFELGRVLLGEIKSINTEGFALLPKATMDPEANLYALSNCGGFISSRLRGYLIQVQNYLRLTNTEEGFLLFDNKNDSNWVDFYLRYDPDFLEPHLTRLKRLDAYRPRLIVPVCTCVGKHKDLCAFKPEDEVSLAEIKIFSEDTA